MSVQIVGSFLETVQGNLSVRGGEFETVGDQVSSNVKTERLTVCYSLYKANTDPSTDWTLDFTLNTKKRRIFYLPPLLQSTLYTLRTRETPSTSGLHEISEIRSIKRPRSSYLTLDPFSLTYSRKMSPLVSLRRYRRSTLQS